MRAALMIIIGSSVLASTAARASGPESFRCGTRLVELGDSLLETAFKCGEPTLQDRRIEQREDGLLVTVDEWTYNLGPEHFTPMLRFENGKLIHIDLGEYGYAE